MDMTQAATFLGASILLMLGVIIVIIGIVIINNIIHKYWKPVNIFTPDSWKAFNPPPVYQPELERLEPKEDNGDKVRKQ